MNMQQGVQSRSAANGFGRRRMEKDGGLRLDNKMQTGKENFNRSTSIGKEGGSDSPLRERLVYLTTCLIGHHVEVQVLDGSVFSGILHAINIEKDFGVILKMARLTKDGSRGQNSVNKPPSTTLIIPSKELLQVVAKGIHVTRDGSANELQREKQQELLIDSLISQSRRAETERELERWVPEADDPVCPELENIFDGHWDRLGWDQFEANETLFGVKSTFNEDLYTTELEKGPQMKELEREALRIAREIEGEDTHDLHLAEERGLQLNEKYEIDEETRFSSVFRGVDDSGFDDIEDILLESRNDETFGGGFVSGTSKQFADLASSVKLNDGAQVPTGSSPTDEAQSSQSTSREIHQSAADDRTKHLSKDPLNAGDIRSLENLAGRTGTSYSKEGIVNQMESEGAQTSKQEDSRSSPWPKKESADKGGLSANASAYAPSHVSSTGPEKTNLSNEPSEATGSSPAQVTEPSSSSRARPSSSASSTSECGGGASVSGGPGLSPSLSVGSLSSDKSTLNPHAKEFKLNPNAKSFKPSQTPLRPASPVSDGSFYYPANVAAVQHMHGVPVGIGIGPSFAAHQPVIYNTQAAPTPQQYFHSSGPQYGRQMMIGHPQQQVLYVPATYTPDMLYKGREF